MLSKRLSLLVAVAVIGSTLLAACATATPEVIEREVEVTKVVKEEVEVTKIVKEEVEPTPAPAWYFPEYEERYGGTAHVAYYQKSPTLDTMTGMAAATCYPAQMWGETLLAFDEDYRIAPMLAKEMPETSDDGRTLTFHLREGIMFHNGTELTAEDVEASFDRYMEPGVGCRQGQFDLMESWQAIDDYTFEVTLKQPSVSILNAIAYPVGDLIIMPKEVIEDKGAGDLQPPEGYDPDMSHDLIGTGPYKITEWNVGQYIMFERNELYKPRPGEEYSGLAGGKIPYFDKVKWHVVPEDQVRVGGMETNVYDWMGALPETEYQRLDEEVENVRPYTVGGAWSLMLLFNHANYPTSELKFRQACLACLNLEEVMKAAAAGVEDFYRLSPSLFVKEGPWYVPPEESTHAEELYNQDDPERAKQLLQEMGYNGEEVTMIIGLTGKYQRALVAVADQLEKKCGINMEIEILDWPGCRARWEEPETWHFSTTGYLSQPLYNPDALGSFWDSRSTSSERGFYENPEMNDAFDQASAALTFEERYEAFKEVQRLYYETLPNIKLGDYFASEAIGSDVNNHKTWYRSNRFWSIWFDNPEEHTE